MSSLALSRAHAAAWIALSLTSCGGGTAGFLAGLGGGDDDGPSPIVVSDLVVESGSGRAAQSPASVLLRLTDSLSRPLSIELLVVPPVGDPFPALLEDGESTLSLASSPQGATHVFGWDFATQLASGATYAEGYRLHARFLGATSGIQTGLVAVGNDAPTIPSIVVPNTTATGTIQIDALVADSAADPVALLVEYQDADLDSAWVAADIAGSGLSQMPSSAGGTTNTFFWNSGADLPQAAANVRIRIRPTDAWSTGLYVASDPFPVDNNGTPVVGVALVVSSTRTSPVSISFTLDDAELDPADVDVLYVPPSGPAVPALLSSGSTTTALPTDGSPVVVQWDFANQLASADGYATGSRLRVRALDGGHFQDTVAFAVGNDAAEIADVAVPSTPTSGAVEASFTVADSSSDAVSVTVEYAIVEDGGAWSTATLLGAPPTNIAADPTGVPVVVLWDSSTDAAGRACTALLRLVASDGLAVSAPLVTDPIAVDNDGTPSVLSAAATGSTRTSPVTISFALQDAELDPADVEVLYVPSSGPAVPALLVSGSTTNLPTDGSSITVQWDFANQLASGSDYATGVRVRVRAIDGGHALDTAPFAVGDDAAEITDTVVPATPTAGIVPVAFTLTDSSSDSVSVQVEYAIAEDGNVWTSASLVGAPPTDIATDAGGVPITIFWNAPLDEGGRTCTARLRLVADDGTLVSTPVVTSPFVVDGNVRPVVFVNGSAFFATPDERRGIPIPFRVVDAEDDPVQVVFQWRTANGGFPTLPDDPADLVPILADATLRRSHQIAEEMPAPAFGSARPVSATTVVLPELATSASQLLASALVGQDVELMRARGAPSAVAATWSANPLVNPVATLTCDDARSAYVLDQHASGTWRVQRVDLATGAVLDAVAQSFGTPGALARGSTSAQLLIASDVAGTWSVVRIDVATGAITTIGTVGGTAPSGTVRGLLATGASSALLTVGAALVAVDAGVATPVVVASGLEAPYGIAFDPRRDGRVLVAERDGTDPVTMLVTGRVVSIDLATLERRTVNTSGPRLLRPESIAVEPGSARLWAVTNASAVDGVRELRHVLLAGGGGGVSAEITATLPDGATGLSVGTDGLVVLTLPGSDLAVAGGVQQTRTITSFAAATCTATVSAPFAPSIASAQTWRIRTDAGVRAVRPASNEQRFVWASDAMPEAGEVVLRAVPYDAARGLAADTGIPRPVRTNLDVTPTTIGGGAATSGATGIVAADLNGDGAADLAVTSQGADTVAIFFQSSAGAFPSAPNVSLSGIPILAPMTNPVAVRAVDVDGDRDLDLITANHGSNNFNVLLQTAPGVFATQLLSLGLGVSGPVDIAVGDFNGDGRTDFVTANESGNNLTVFFQLLAGLYLPLPSLTLGGAGTTAAPSAVAAGDLDLDGDLDIVCTSVGADRVSVFLQGSPGSFPSTPSFSIGGAGTTPDPSSLALGDVDGDGRLDIAVANRTSNSVAIFLQISAGAFPVTPDVVLASAIGPVGPKRIELADITGDGALDVLTIDADDELTVFVRDPASASFGAQGVTIDGAGLLSGPERTATGDFDGDGTVDVAVTNSTAGNVALFLQRGAGVYSTTSPDVTRGSATDTPGASDVAVADLDGDGDLDFAVAAPTSGRIVTYEQWSPAVLGSLPRQTLGSNATTAGVSAVCAADLDGDGRIDLVGANTTAGTLAIFHQLVTGVFATLPDATIGAGALGGVNSVVAADLDGDRRCDLVCSNPTSNDVAVFLQASNGTFPSAPSFRRGGAGATNGAHHVITADVDLDGDLDVVSANRTQNNVTVFAQTSPGVFGVAPAITVGNAVATAGPRSVVARDVDGDGRVDIACANSTGNSVALFLRSAAGTYPGVPTLTLTHASMTGPTTLAAEDLDGDGLAELVSGSTGSQRILVFRQRVRGTYSTTPQSVGSAAFTPSPGRLVVVDLDGDGDLDVVSPQATTSQTAVYFGSH